MNADYLQEFKTRVEVVTQYGGEVGTFPTVVKANLEVDAVDKDALTEEETAAAKKKAAEKHMAMMLLGGADRTRYQKLIDDLQNDYAKGTDNYPTTVVGA